MADLVTYVAVVCAPVMAVVGRVMGTADDRRERARLAELDQLRRQFEGPDEERTPTA